MPRVVAGVVGVLALIIGGLVVPAVASTTSPIVGTWTHSGGGAIQIVASGATSYVGTVTSAINFGSCTHPVGERIWTLNDTQYSNEFSGTHVMCNGSTGTALARLDDIDNASPPTLRLDLYVNGTSSGELRRPGSLTTTPAPTPTPSATPTPTPTSPLEPRIAISVPREVATLSSAGVRVPVTVRTRGNGSEPFNWQVDVYGPSSTLPFQRGQTGQTGAAPGRDTAVLTFNPTAVSSGAYYACGWGMTDVTEIRTPNAPKSDCVWLQVQQRPVAWTASRDCTLPYEGSPTSWMAGQVRYGGTSVPFWRACSIRDSGYLGMTVADPRTGRWYDFRTWTRAEVDDLFYDLLGRECRIALSKKPAALRACLGGGASDGNRPLDGIGRTSYYSATRAAGLPLFDVNLVMPGIQQTPDYAAVPSGGQRSND